MNIYKITYGLNSEIYNVDVLASSAEEAELIIHREHPDSTVIAVSSRV
jgi:hypothetical protein